MWFVLGLLSAFFLGCYDISKKISLRDNAVVPVLFSSVACSALLLLPFLLASRWAPETMADTPFFVPEVDVRTHGFIFLKSVIVLASWAFGFFSMKNLPITLVSPINATRPMWTLVGALLIFHEQLSLYQWIGILLALLSFMAFSFVGRKEGVSFVHNKWIYCLIIAVVLGAASGLYDKYLMHRFDRMAVQVYYMIYQALLMVVFLFLWKFNPRRGTSFQWRWSIVFISIFLVLADFVYFYALSYPDSLISVLSTVRRAGVVVPFAYGVWVLHDKNPKLKSFCLLGVLLGMLFLFLGTMA